MSTATAHLLQEFERLSLKEQREFSAVISSEQHSSTTPTITDEELTASAARIVAMFDAEEDARRAEA